MSILNNYPKRYARCKNNLYRSAYIGFAFISGKDYEIIKIDKEFIWVKDERGHGFNLSLLSKFPYYHVKDYFEDKYRL